MSNDDAPRDLSSDPAVPPRSGASAPGHSYQASAGGTPSMPPPPSAQTPVPVGRPAAMDLAVRLMRVGAVLSLLQALSTLLFKGQIQDAATNAATKSGGALTPDQINAIVTTAMVVAVISGLIAAGLWLWMASANGKGKSWARILATIFFVLSLLSLLTALVQGTTPLVSLILSVVTILVGAYVIFLLYKKESTAFYRASSAPRM